jgi:hypothetical protein
METNENAVVGETTAATAIPSGNGFRCSSCDFKSRTTQGIAIHIRWRHNDIAAFESNGSWFPMVAADEERARSLEPMAQAIADTGLVVTLVEFSKRERKRI